MTYARATTRSGSISIIPIGSRPKRFRDDPLWRERSDEGNHSRRRLRHAALSGDACCLEAATAGLRQADDLLPSEHADAGGDSRHPDHLDAAGYAALCRTAGRRAALGHFAELCGAAESGWAGTG